MSEQKLILMIFLNHRIKYSTTEVIYCFQNTKIYINKYQYKYVKT